MKTVSAHIRDHLLITVEPKRMPDLETLQRTENCPEFDRLCLYRMIMGSFRYGLIGRRPGKPEYDRVASMIARLEKYKDDRNAEHLLDVANLAKIEYVEGDHLGVMPINDGTHTRTK